jgi:hypothetical protein
MGGGGEGGRGMIGRCSAVGDVLCVGRGGGRELVVVVGVRGCECVRVRMCICVCWGFVFVYGPTRVRVCVHRGGSDKSLSPNTLSP